MIKGRAIEKKSMETYMYYAKSSNKSMLCIHLWKVMWVFT